MEQVQVAQINPLTSLNSQLYTALMDIRLLRERNGYTRKEISEELGISSAYYSMLETGKKPLSKLPLDKAVHLSDLLKCRPEELLG